MEIWKLSQLYFSIGLAGAMSTLLHDAIMNPADGKLYYDFYLFILLNNSKKVLLFWIFYTALKKILKN